MLNPPAAAPGPDSGLAERRRTALLISAALAAVPGPGPGAAGRGRTAGHGLLLSATLAATPGACPKVVGEHHLLTRAPPS